MSKRIITGSLVAIAIIGGALFAARQPISLALVDTMVSKRMGDQLADLPDALHIGLCGTGSPFPDPKRSAPCTVVVAGKQVLLFDVGSGTPKQLARMSLSAGMVDHVFLTHFHSDHIDGLGELMMTRWAQRREDNRMAVHGPTGTSQIVEGFERAYGLDTGYRTAHHGADVMPPALSGAKAVEFAALPKGGLTVFENQGLTVEAFSVDHSPVEPAMAYRVSYQGRIAVISGDTAHTQAVIDAAKGADVLIHEALHTGLVKLLEDVAAKNNRPRLAKILSDIPDYHTTPVQAADVAKQAGVKALVYTHIVPPLPLPPLEDIFLEGTADAFDGDIKLGADGDWITLLPNDTVVSITQRYQ